MVKGLVMFWDIIDKACKVNYVNAILLFLYYVLMYNILISFHKVSF